jgi:hypothetical protein
MSDNAIALILTFFIIAAIFIWVPFLHFICRPCGRLFKRYFQKVAPKAQASSDTIRD